MRTLIIAPRHPDLPSAANGAAAASAHPGSTLLAGHLSEHAIATARAEGGFDPIWLATHGAEDHILLSNSILLADALITYIAASGAHTVILNTCASIDDDGHHRGCGHCRVQQQLFKAR